MVREMRKNRRGAWQQASLPWRGWWELSGRHDRETPIRVPKRFNGSRKPWEELGQSERQEIKDSWLLYMSELSLNRMMDGKRKDWEWISKYKPN